MIKLANKLIKALTGKFNAGAFPPVQDPKADAAALYTTANGMKIGYEVLTRRRGDVGDSALLVKEVDYLLELLTSELDSRYNFDTALEQSDSNIAALVKEFEALIDKINAHIGNEGIHGGGDETTIIEEGCCIDDATVSTETSWSSQKTKNELPHRLYSTRHTDVATGGIQQVNQALIANESALFALQYPTIWRGPWVLGPTYYKGDQVEDEGWLMTCNAVEGTEERAGPQIHGGETFIFSDTPAWTTVNATGLVKQTMKITMEPNLCQQFRVWPSSVGSLVNHYMEVIIRRGGPDSIPVSRSYFNPLLIAGQWNVLQFADAPLPDGTVVDVIYYVIDASTETQLGPYDYIYEGTSQTAGPPSGGWNVTNQRDILRISKTDADGIDRSGDIATGKPGSRVLFIVEGSLELRQEYFVLSDPLDEGDYYSMNVSIIEASGAIEIGARCLGSGLIPVPQATDYVKIVGYFPAGDPEWGVCETSLTVGGVPTSEPNTTGYGMDVGAAPGIISDQWDYNNYSEVSPGI